MYVSLTCILVYTISAQMPVVSVHVDKESSLWHSNNGIYNAQHDYDDTGAF